MKNKLISKGLVIGTIILLMSTTPLIIATSVNENTQPSTVNDFGNNSLGKIRIIHVPLYIKFLKNRGIDSYVYYPPDDNPGYDYYFCEVDGKVLMNFSLTVEHRLNKLGPFFFDRVTWINDLWIGTSTDYFRIEHKQPCVNESWETYYVNMTEENQIEPLVTNGQDVTLQFFLYGMPVITTSDGVHTLMELLMPFLKSNFLESEGGKIPITIHPIQC